MRLYLNLALGLIVISALSLQFAHADDGNPNDGVGSAAYARVLNYQDTCQDRINDSQAQDVASLVEQGLLDMPAFLNAYSLSCSFDSAITVGEGSLNGTLDAAVYARTLNYRDECGQSLSDVEAQSVARLCAQGAIDLNAFLDTYDNSCNFDSGIAVGAGEVTGGIPAAWYTRVLDYPNACNTEITDSQAQEIANFVGQNTVDLGSFLDNYYRSCNFDQALAASSAQG